MRPGRDGFALLVALATSATACASATTQASIAAAEAGADVRSSAGQARIEAPPLEKTTPATEAAESDGVALDGPLELASLEAAALARQPGLVAASHRVRALTERARAEGRLPPPEVGAEMWQVPFARPYALDKAGMIMFSVRQQFPAAGALDKMAEATALEAQAEVARGGAEARALVREVDRAFADYAEGTARHAAHDAHRAIVEQMTAAARARYTTGAPLSDVTRAELERARTEAELEREHGVIDEARARLNGLLARPTDAPLGRPQQPEARTAALGPAQAEALAAAGSPEILAATRLEESARAAAGAADREASVPVFSAGLSAFLPVSDTPAGYGVSFAMSLPWVWGAAAGRARSAEQKVLAARATASGARVRARSEAGTALVAVRAAERRMVVLRDAVLPAAHRAVDAARAGYAAGGVGLPMWLEAARAALEIDVDLATARGDLDRALADLDWAAGGHVPRAPLTAFKEPDHAP